MRGKMGRIENETRTDMLHL